MGYWSARIIAEAHLRRKSDGRGADNRAVSLDKLAVSGYALRDATSRKAISSHIYLVLVGDGNAQERFYAHRVVSGDRDDLTVEKVLLRALD